MCSASDRGLACHTRRVNGQRVVGACLTASMMLVACDSGSVRAPSKEANPQSVLTHAQYQDALHKVVTSADTRAATQFFSKAVASDDAGMPCSERVHGLEESLTSMLQQVMHLNPPPDAEAQQRAFLDAANESVRLVGVAADDVDEGRLRCGVELNKRIYGLPSTARAERAIQALEDRGYMILGQ